MKRMLFLLIALPLMSSCEKDFLDKKPDKSLLVPETLEDFQAILDNAAVMNRVPALGAIASDDYYLTDDVWPLLNLSLERNSYIWAKDVYEISKDVQDWDICYQQIFYSNIVLDGLEKLTSDSGKNYDAVKGSALFYRGTALYNLAQIFAAPYDPATAAQTPGLPVHIHSDVNEMPGRGTLQQTYDQVVRNLQQSSALLPASASVKSRPVEATAKAMLARTYLTMQNYDRAKLYADSTLQLVSGLIDYNTLDNSSDAPFPIVLPDGNKEVLLYSEPVAYSFYDFAYIDSSLYRSYADNDLRKSLFFYDLGNGTVYGRKNYMQSAMAVDEVYLIRAECEARNGDPGKAMDDLNTLLAKRWKQGTFTSYTALDKETALKLVLQERRKELVYRGTQWTDLRRLNQEPEQAITLKRVINGQTYELPPGDNRYVFPIPDNEMEVGEIEQNPR